jgi:uncharacterized protein
LAEAPEPFTVDPEGVTLRVRVTPKASRDAIGPVVADGQGNAVLKIAVTAAPEDGKANRAVARLLAKAWRLPKTSVEIIHGETARSKTIRIVGNGDAVARAIRHNLGLGGTT